MKCKVFRIGFQWLIEKTQKFEIITTYFINLVYLNKQIEKYLCIDGNQTRLNSFVGWWLQIDFVIRSKFVSKSFVVVFSIS